MTIYQLLKFVKLCYFHIEEKLNSVIETGCVEYGVMEM